MDLTGELDLPRHLDHRAAKTHAREEPLRRLVFFGGRVRAGDGGPPDEITVHTPVSFEVCYWNLKPYVRLNLSLVLYNQDGTCAFSSATKMAALRAPSCEPKKDA